MKHMRIGKLYKHFSKSIISGGKMLSQYFSARETVKQEIKHPKAVKAYSPNIVAEMEKQAEIEFGNTGEIQFYEYDEMSNYDTLRSTFYDQLLEFDDVDLSNDEDDDEDLVDAPEMSEDIPVVPLNTTDSNITYKCQVINPSKQASFCYDNDFLQYF